MSEKVLSTSLRPRSLTALQGQDAMVKSIRNQMAKRVPSAWLFSGPPGTGKTTVARILSIAYQCEHMKLWGDPCDECWKKKESFAVHEISGSDVTGIDELRKVVEMSRFRPRNSGGRRVIIVDEAQKISNSAMNMLLVPFEKPTDHVAWIICTTEPNKIIAALRRRCVQHQMKTLGYEAAEKFLAKQASRAEIKRDLAPLYEQCHLMQVSSPGVLLMALEKYATGVSAVEAVSGVDDSGIDSLRICKAVTNGKWSDVMSCLKDATPEHARLIRASVAGWLVGVMKRETMHSGLDRAASSLLDLAGPPFDDAAMIHWLWGTLYKVTKRYQK